MLCVLCAGLQGSVWRWWLRRRTARFWALRSCPHRRVREIQCCQRTWAETVPNYCWRRSTGWAAPNTHTFGFHHLWGLSIDSFHVTSHPYRNAHLAGKTKLCSTDHQLFLRRLHQVNLLEYMPFSVVWCLLINKVSTSASANRPPGWQELFTLPPPTNITTLQKTAVKWYFQWHKW